MSITQELICPLSLETLIEPITVPCCGKAFSRDLLVEWLTESDSCPLCRGDLSQFNASEVSRNNTIQAIIDTINNGGLTRTAEEASYVPDNFTTVLDIPCISTVIPTLDERSSGFCELKFQIPDITLSKNSIILVADVSGSMSGSPIQQAIAAIEGIYQMCKNRPEIVLRLVAYDNSGREVDITDPQARSQRIFTSGGTSFAGAFDAITKVIKRDQIANTHVIFFTDGQGESNWTQLTDAFAKNAELPFIKKLIINTVGLGSGHDFNFLNYLRNAGNVPGIYQFADSSESIDSISTKLSDVFNSVNASLGGEIIISGAGSSIKTFSDSDGNVSVFIGTHNNDLTVEYQGKKVSLKIDTINSNCPNETITRFYMTRLALISSEILELNDADPNVIGKDAIDLWYALILQKISALKNATTSTGIIDRLSLLILEIEKIKSGKKIEVRTLVDMTYASNLSAKVPVAKVKLNTPAVSDTPTEVKTEVYVSPLSVTVNNTGRGYCNFIERPYRMTGGQGPFPHANGNTEDSIKTNSNGYNSLHSAAKKGHVRAMVRLVNCATDFDFISNFPMSPLEIALLFKNAKCATIIINEMNKRGVTMKWYNSPDDIAYTCSSTYYKSTEVILKHITGGISKNLENSMTGINLGFFMSRGYTVAGMTFDFKVSRGIITPDDVSKHEVKYEHLADRIYNNDLKSLKLLMPNRMPLSDSNKGYLIRMAAARGSTEIMEFIITNLDC
jgi:uncharacterized protein YegL